jgi:hypothetical protein
MRQLSGTLFSRAELALLLALLLMPAVRIHAQVFKIEGGDSTLFQAQGGSVEFKAPNYSGSLGLGFFDGRFEMGANLRAKFRGFTYTAGDDSVRFDLPTDIFDTDYYFFARGLGVSKEEKDRGFYAFAGMTSNWLGTGFFQAAQAEDPVAIFFFHRKLTDKLKFYSRSILSKQETALEALEWQPEKWLKMAVSGGIGSGHGYFATAFDAETKKLTLRASYIAASPDFRRIMVPSILNAEANKENIDVTYQVNPALSLTAGHHNLLQPLTLDSPLTQATMNDVSGTFHFSGTFLGAGLFNSSVSGRDTQGVNLYVGHRFHERLDVTTNYFASRTPNEPSNAMFSGTFREIITPRLSVLQLVTRANGQWTMAYGGEFVTNRFSVRADYQNVYLPLRPDRPFEQALALNASVRLFGSVRLNVASSVAPDGHIRYTFGGSTYLYRYRGLAPWQSHGQESYSFPKYLVQGVVRDKDGNPVAGAALSIDGKVIYTDDGGRFLYRSRKHTRLKFQVLTDQFLVPGVFEVVQAPNDVVTEMEDKAADIGVVIRRSRTAPIELRQIPGQVPGEVPSGGPQIPATEPTGSGEARPMNR